MKTKPLILLAGAVTLAAASALVARSLLRPPPPPPPATVVQEVQAPRVPSRLVLTAAHALEPGVFIDGRALAWQEQADDAARVDQLMAAADSDRRQLERELYGATLRRPVAAGQPLTRDALLYSGEPGFLGAVLRPGQRAVSIPTSAVASNAGLVNAGDQVDVILSLNRADLQPIDGQPNSVYSGLASETIVRNARVLALNNNTAGLAPVVPPAAEATPQADNGNRRTSAQSAQRMFYESITLEVSPAEAEKLAVASEAGSLRIALRSVHGEMQTTAQTPVTGVTRIGETTRIFGSPPPPLPPPQVETVRAFRGVAQEDQILSGVRP